jgi:hypothetical protein
VNAHERQRFGFEVQRRKYGSFPPPFRLSTHIVADRDSRFSLRLAPMVFAHVHLLLGGQQVFTRSSSA